MAKKKQHKPAPQLNPIEYIKTKARTLPIYKCYLNTDWMEKGLANIIVARQHTNGNFTFGLYQVDIFCKGLEFTSARFNEKEEMLEEIIAQFIPQKEDFFILLAVDYTLVHNIIYGGIAFAEEHNYKPGKDFNITKYILEEDDEKIELMEIEFGVNGEAVLIDRSHEDEDDESKYPAS